MRPAEILRVIEPLSVSSSDIEHDWQRLFRMDAADDRERQRLPLGIPPSVTTITLSSRFARFRKSSRIELRLGYEINNPAAFDRCG